MTNKQALLLCIVGLALEIAIATMDLWYDGDRLYLHVGADGIRLTRKEFD